MLNEQDWLTRAAPSGPRPLGPAMPREHTRSSPQDGWVSSTHASCRRGAWCHAICPGWEKLWEKSFLKLGKYEYTNNNTVILLSGINTLTINSLFVSASLQHHLKCRTIDLIQGFSGDVVLLAHACNKCYRCLSQIFLHTRYLVF